MTKTSVVGVVTEPGLEWYERIRHAAEIGAGVVFLAEEVEVLWDRVRAPDPVRLGPRRARRSRAREHPPAGP